MPGVTLEGRGIGLTSPPEAARGGGFSSKMFRQEESEIGISVF